MGRPLEPANLHAMGALKAPAAPPKGFDPSGGWTQTWRIWTCYGYRQRANKDAGFLRLQRAGRGAPFTLEVAQELRTPDNVVHRLDASIQCAHDRLASPGAWSLSSRFRGGGGRKPPPATRGVSLRPALEGKGRLGRGHVVSEVNDNRGRMVRTARYKYVTYAGDPVEQLFDMQADPGETRNLAEASEHAAALREPRPPAWPTDGSLRTRLKERVMRRLCLLTVLGVAAVSLAADWKPAKNPLMTQWAKD
ncbi:MAG: hypothetical protein ACOC8D_02575, partial [bacterium]